MGWTEGLRLRSQMVAEDSAGRHGLERETRSLGDLTSKGVLCLWLDGKARLLEVGCLKAGDGKTEESSEGGGEQLGLETVVGR